MDVLQRRDSKQKELALIEVRQSRILLMRHHAQSMLSLKAFYCRCFLIATLTVLSLMLSVPTSTSLHRKPKIIQIFTYDIPDILLRPNAGITNCKADMIMLPKIVKGSIHSTQNASQADYFLLPQYSTCYYHNCVFAENKTTEECKYETGDYVSNIWNHIIKENPVHWHTNAGADHLLVFAWDQASEILGWNHTVRKAVKNAIHLTTFGTVDWHSNFDPHKDIVIPPYTDYSQVMKKLQTKSWDISHGISSENAWPDNNRSMFAYFRGTFIDDVRYSQGVRQYLWELGKTHPNKYHIHQFHSPNYWDEMAESIFSLCPSGWSPWSPRLFDSMVSGAIPVVFADGTRLPFEKFIDYRSFSIKVNNSAVSNINEILESVDNIPLKRRNMQRYRKDIVWDMKRDSGLAFTNLIKELERKLEGYPRVGNSEYT